MLTIEQELDFVSSVLADGGIFQVSTYIDGTPQKIELLNRQGIDVSTGYSLWLLWQSCVYSERFCHRRIYDSTTRGGNMAIDAIELKAGAA